MNSMGTHEGIEGADGQSVVVDNVKSDPIIFARSETVHIPARLVRPPHPLAGTIYQTDKDGRLKKLPTIDEGAGGGESSVSCSVAPPMVVSPATPLTSPSGFEGAPSLSKSDRKRVNLFMRLFRTCFKGQEEDHIQVEEEDDSYLGPNALAFPNEVPMGVSPSMYVLPRQRPPFSGKKTLVLDLDETLVHSSFQPVLDSHYIIPVEIEGNVYSVYVYKRPGVIEFIEAMSKMYELVVYTASLRKYADPLLDQMDPERHISHRLFREHCVNNQGIYVKNLDLLGRDLAKTIIIDNASASFMFHPQNGIECSAFINDFSDHELQDLTPFLEYLYKQEDVRLCAGKWPSYVGRY